MTTDRSFVLAGGGRGIGAATARRLLASGAQVTVLDAFGLTDPLYPLASEDDAQALEGAGARCQSVDLRDAAAVTVAVNEAARDGLDVAITFAGVIAGGAPLWETPSEQLDALWAANTRTAWNLAHAAVPHLLQRPAQRRPTFVATTSVAGEHGLFGLSAYVVTKHATAGIVRALAADLAGTPVTAVGVAPGATDTTMLRRTAEIYAVEPAVLAQGQHSDGPLAADDVAAVIELAASAGPIVHGAILPADGGFARV